MRFLGSNKENLGHGYCGKFYFFVRMITVLLREKDTQKLFVATYFEIFYGKYLHNN